MKKDKTDELFRHLQGEFDLEETPINHQQRFLEKLHSYNTQATKRQWNFRPKPWMTIAACVAILISVVFSIKMNNQPAGLAAVSPKMAQTQDFYTATIHKELKKIANQKTPETKILVEDAMFQMKKLEQDFAILQKDLIKSGDDSRVIYAMIANFQMRISLLKKVLEQIEHVKLLKQENHENPIVI